jgi:hypothetical protein
MGFSPMTTFFKKLWQDKRGNALIIAGGALPLLVGSVGLATDTVQWVTWKRQLQRAADSAAFAGAYAKFQEESASAAVDGDLTTNNHLWVPLLSGYPQVSEPADTGGYTRIVEVSLAAQRSLTFSSMFLSSAPVISVTARAAAIDSGYFCAIASETDNTSGIIIQGSATVNLGCGMISNSPHASVSVGVNGNAHNVTADPVAGVGGVPQINGVANEQSYHLAQPDPYKDLYDTDIPTSEQPCGSMSDHTVSVSGGVTTLEPGCYTGNNQFKFNGGTTHLQPGTYYLDGTDFVVTGNADITGTGVTIILTGSTPGQLSLNGTGSVVLKAPTTGPFANMLLMQSPGASNSDGNLINGNSGTSFDGSVYFPNQGLKFSGSSGASTKCVMVVSRRIDFEGNANLQNDLSGCTAATKVRGKVIRLIA